MYKEAVINQLVEFIRKNDGIGDKNILAQKVKEKFSLTQDRKVFCCSDFAIRFCHSENKRFSNTVLSLSALQKFDSLPFIVCVVGSQKNHLMIANTTFLKKISHSSKELRVDNIKGSFNGGDIIMEWNDLINEPCNFPKLFAYHEGLTFDDNLQRLVESTNGIVGRNHRYELTPQGKAAIFQSVPRAQKFLTSAEYTDLLNDLNDRVHKVKREIVIASCIDNVNLRGRIIEYLITDNDSNLREQIRKALNESKVIPQFKTKDKLGDYFKEYEKYKTETDIKTKIMFLEGNPKAYNIDKLLEFLASPKAVYMIYLLGIVGDGSIVTKLCSSLDTRLIEATTMQHHWAGRLTRGVTQFDGKVLRDLLKSPVDSIFDEEKAMSFLSVLMDIK